MAFINVRFPDAISLGGKERIRNSTSVVRVNSGATSRNQNWQFPFREFDVSHAARLKPLMDQLVAFNVAVAQGMANSFRYKAWADYTVAASEGTLLPLTSSTWQLAKRYTFGSSFVDRPIKLPFAPLTQIVGTGTYTFDDQTGIVTKTGGADPTGWSGQFDVFAYMGSDLAEYTIIDKSGATLIMGLDQILVLEDR